MSYSDPVQEKTFKTSAGAIAAYLAVKKGTEGNCLKATANSANLGITSAPTTAAGEETSVVLLGIAEALLGDTVSFGDELKSDANGKLVPIDTTTATAQNVIAIAMADGVANDVIPVLVHRQTVQLSTFPWASSGGLLPGAVEQGTHEASATQNYALGTRRVTADGRAFRYVKAGTGGLQPEFGCCYPLKTITVAIAPAQASGAGAIGDLKVTITVGAGDGVAGNGHVALDELAGGHVVIGNGANQHPMNRLIVGNTAVAGSGGACTLTLDEALETAVTVGTTTIETLMNRYAYVTSGNVTNSAYVTFVGMPATVLAAGEYGWVQTRGPAWITSNSNTCNSANDRTLYFLDNGSVVSGADVTYAGKSYQIAGLAIDMSGSASSNAPFIDLQCEA